MKSKRIVGLLILTLLTLTACTKKVDPPTSTGSQTSSYQNALVLYFSVPETTKTKDMTIEEANSSVVIDGKTLGNTQYVAQVIQEQTQADIVRIEPKEPYTTNHEALVKLASKEQKEDFRPILKNTIQNFDAYDTIFIGYPIWWSDMPMILYTLFDTYDFSGKTILPFSTHGGSGLVDTIDTIKRLEPQANVREDAFTVSRDNVAEAKQKIIAWLQESNNS